MKIALLSNEYPPHVYGGAGVHVEYLSRELAKLDPQSHVVKVLCFGEQDERSPAKIVQGIEAPVRLPYQDPRHQKLFDALLRNLIMAGTLSDVDLIHCHTWYTHLAGCMLKQLLRVPLVLTTHSLEVHRPWKEEQLGSGYGLSAWLERTAYENADGVIAVSPSMKRDAHELYGVSESKLRVIYNGIDTQQYQPTPDPAVLTHYGIDPDRPFVLFVGRITRQKGVGYWINAIPYLREGIQVVLCAGMPDTDEIAKETTQGIERARAQTSNAIIWVPEFVPKEHAIRLYSQATLFVCPSVYEPFGIVNLEAMSCGTPVVASAVGGIPEVVVHGETGLLVPLEPTSHSDFEPKYPERFSKDLAEAVNSLLGSPETLKWMGINARQRVEERFSWEMVAKQTFLFYEELVRMNPSSSS